MRKLRLLQTLFNLTVLLRCCHNSSLFNGIPFIRKTMFYCGVEAVSTANTFSFSKCIIYYITLQYTEHFWKKVTIISAQLSKHQQGFLVWIPFFWNKFTTLISFGDFSSIQHAGICVQFCKTQKLLGHLALELHAMSEN